VNTADIDWSQLTPEAQATVAELVVPLTEGYLQVEIARTLGVAPKVVSARLTRLRLELLAARYE
jgi:hypothetical protein